MKLIIDIPKSEYMKIKRYYDSLPEYSTVEAETFYIAHGTPLDSVESKGWNPLESDEEGMIIGSLPEEGKEVFITVYGQVEIDSFGCEFEYDESVGDYRNKWFCENNDIEDVTAWMPLPEPYKAEKPETCKGCLEPCIMYEPDMRACKKKVKAESEDT